MQTYIKTIFDPLSKSKQICFVQNKLEDIYQIFVATHHFIQQLVFKTTNITPFQVDLIILINKVKTDDNDNENDRDEEKQTDDNDNNGDNDEDKNNDDDKNSDDDDDDFGKNLFTKLEILDLIYDTQSIKKEI